MFAYVAIFLSTANMAIFAMSNRDSEGEPEATADAPVSVTVKLLPSFVRYYEDIAKKFGQTVGELVAEEIQRHEFETLQEMSGLDVLNSDYDGLDRQGSEFLKALEQREKAEREKRKQSSTAPATEKSEAENKEWPGPEVDFPELRPKECRAGRRSVQRPASTVHTWSCTSRYLSSKSSKGSGSTHQISFRPTSSSL
jgi:hypothetical protein